MTYKLYFKNELIGEVTDVVTDFSSAAGKLHFDSAFQISAHFKEYIKFCNRCSELLLKGPKSQAEYENLISLDEKKFGEFIDSEEWYMVDAMKNRHNITVPFFGSDAEIIWAFA